MHGKAVSVNRTLHCLDTESEWEDKLNFLWTVLCPDLVATFPVIQRTSVERLSNENCLFNAGTIKHLKKINNMEHARRVRRFSTYCNDHKCMIMDTGKIQCTFC